MRSHVYEYAGVTVQIAVTRDQHVTFGGLVYWAIRSTKV